MPGSKQGSGHSCSFPVPSMRLLAKRKAQCGGGKRKEARNPQLGLGPPGSHRATGDLWVQERSRHTVASNQAQNHPGRPAMPSCWALRGSKAKNGLFVLFCFSAFLLLPATPRARRGQGHV